jgi:hypothetical protein
MDSQSIRNLDKGIWRKFAAYCKLKGVNVGGELSVVLEDYLKKNFKELLK